MRISDFGLLDLDGNPDHHQNWTHWSLGHALPLQEISSKSVHNFFSYPTDRQTDWSENITSFGGGNNKHDNVYGAVIVTKPLQECTWFMLMGDVWTKPTGLSRKLSCSLYKPRPLGNIHPPLPFITITQHESWYSFYRPTEGRRLSRPWWLHDALTPYPCKQVSDWELKQRRLVFLYGPCGLGRTVLF